jgi:hypothetical protein
MLDILSTHVHVHAHIHIILTSVFPAGKSTHPTGRLFLVDGGHDILIPLYSISIMQ